MHSIQLYIRCWLRPRTARQSAQAAHSDLGHELAQRPFEDLALPWQYLSNNRSREGFCSTSGGEYGGTCLGNGFADRDGRAHYEQRMALRAGSLRFNLLPLPAESPLPADAGQPRRGTRIALEVTQCTASRNVNGSAAFEG